MSFLGKNLRFIRQHTGQTLVDFAQHIGVWEDSLRRYERGREEPNLDTLLGIADALGMPLDRLLRRDLETEAQRHAQLDIRLVLFDVDGTLTDGSIYYTAEGDEIKRFNAKDGLIMHRLVSRQRGLTLGLVSGSKAEGLIRRRAEYLGIEHVYAGARPKTEVVAEWLAELKLSFAQTAFIGDDLNDLPLMKKVGLSACPSDAARQVRAAVDVVLSQPGGHGCAREFLEEVLGYDVAE
ncbi:MAG: HAD-IIIA family hydrolase [Bacteroidetes bacterium]|nr:MAG: HAD-IIIA family hydrolase [Bacteroidota bacterium]